MNRRVLLGAIGASAVAATTMRSLRADESVSRAATDLYNSSFVFDANLGPPVQDTFPFPKASLDMVRQSGVTACKLSLGGVNESFEDTTGEVALLQRIFEEYPDVFCQVRKFSDFAEARRRRAMGVVLSFEAVTMLEDKIDRIELFRDLGVRVMQLTYNVPSPFGTGVLGDKSAGLTPLGHKAVAAMNKLGVAIDLSHSNETTSFDVLKASSRPAIVTHAGCAAIHAHPRNKSDALLRAVANAGGVVGIYDLPYLTASPRQPTVDDYIAHMVHALSVCGEDHVGIGSDANVQPFDTSPKGMDEFRKSEAVRVKAGVAAPEEDRPTYVVGLNTPRRAEVIADALLKHGYTPRTVEKILGLNFLNALRDIWRD